MGQCVDLIEGLQGAVIEPVQGTSYIEQRSAPRIRPRRTDQNTLVGATIATDFRDSEAPAGGVFPGLFSGRRMGFRVRQAGASGANATDGENSRTI